MGCVASSAGGPLPGDLGLPVVLGVGEDIHSFVDELVVGVAVVVQEVQVPGVVEVAIGGVAEVDDPALLDAPVGVDHLDALVAEGRGAHPADPVDRHEAVSHALRLPVPALAGVLVVAEERPEPSCRS